MEGKGDFCVHFEKELGQVVEREITQSVNRQFLSIIYSQLNSIKKDNEKLFYEALICIDNNLNPKDLRIPEQIAIGYTYDYIQEKQRVEKKEFRFFNQDITDEFNKTIFFTEDEANNNIKRRLKHEL